MTAAIFVSKMFHTHGGMHILRPSKMLCTYYDDQSIANKIYIAHPSGRMNIGGLNEKLKVSIIFLDCRLGSDAHLVLGYSIIVAYLRCNCEIFSVFHISSLDTSVVGLGISLSPPLILHNGNTHQPTPTILPTAVIHPSMCPEARPVTPISGHSKYRKARTASHHALELFSLRNRAPFSSLQTGLYTFGRS